MDTFESRIDKLNLMIKTSKKIVFFGGAGVSTESGVPDFRSKDGLYNQHDVKFDKYQPEYLLSHSCLYNEPNVFFEYYRQKMDCRGIEPNITHYKLAEMEKKGKLSSIITQNIDGLHQKAGSKNVIEIHGTTQKVYCSNCGKFFNSDFIFESKDLIPCCECGGIIRPDVTLYEEQLPSLAWNEAVKEIYNSDLFIIGGTSLTVYPANSLIQYFRGRYLVMINRDETMHDTKADLIFHENLGMVFERVLY